MVPILFYQWFLIFYQWFLLIENLLTLTQHIPRLYQDFLPEFWHLASNHIPISTLLRSILHGTPCSSQPNFLILYTPVWLSITFSKLSNLIHFSLWLEENGFEGKSLVSFALTWTCVMVAGRDTMLGWWAGAFSCFHQFGIWFSRAWGLSGTCGGYQEHSGTFRYIANVFLNIQEHVEGIQSI